VSFFIDKEIFSEDGFCHIPKRVYRLKMKLMYNY